MSSFFFPIRRCSGSNISKTISFSVLLYCASFLVCAGVGEIEVTSKPQGAEVYLDDSLTGLTTNCLLTEVPSGNHTVKVVFGVNQYSEDVEVTRDQKTLVEASIAEVNELLWKYDGTGWIGSCPAIGDDGTVYFTSEDGTITALNPRGSLKWQKTIGSELPSAPTLGPDGNVYVSSNTQILICFDIDGNMLWQYRDSMPGGHVRASAAIADDGTIYVLTDTLVYRSYPDSVRPDNRLYAFKSDGTLISYFDGIAIGRCTSPALSSGVLYTGDQGFRGYGGIIAVTTTGVVKWRKKYYGSFFASPAIGSDGTVYIGFSTTVNPAFLALDPEGDVLWRLDLTMVAGTSPVIGPDGTIYFNTENGYVYAVNPSGSIKWTYLHSGAGSIESSPVVGADGTVYAATCGSDGKNYVLALTPQGSLSWSYEVDQPVPYLTISPEGILYCPSGKSIYAFYIGQALSDSPWPKFQHDIKNTGRYGAE